MPGDVGLPSEEEIAKLISGAPFPSTKSLTKARAILSLIRPAFEAKEREIEAASEEAAENASRETLWRDQLAREEARALSAEAKLAQAVEELSGLRQAIVDAAVICDDDEKAGDRLDRLARAIRARSASARGATP
ncbi:hypothetical protein ACFPOB_27315 [Bosea eneae]|uniref:Uncharacterized protein n=1 Tax=Bosea eneae TaxID=151454 RepID=A0ABW0J0S4_9HYPH